MASKKVIAVIDLKAFYAYVECVDRGLDPWNAPLVVADKSRSVNTIILSVTPYLKAHGVPSRLRVKDLPKGFNYIFATPRMERYIEKSCEIMNIITDFVSDEDIHVYSIDEAFIDLSSYISYYKMTPLEIIKMILAKIKEKTDLQATGGIGDNFFLAKVALDLFAKSSPDGIATLHIEDVPTKIWPISPLNKIWGIGPRLESRLNKMGIYNMGQLAHADPIQIHTTFGIMGDQLIEHANGIDESDMHEVYTPKDKSLSFGQTLFKDYYKDEIIIVIRELTEDLAAKLRAQNDTTDVVSLFIGYSGGKGGYHHQLSLFRRTNDTDEIFSAIKTIWDKYTLNEPIRQVSVSIGHLENTKPYDDISIFTSIEEEDKEKNLSKMIDLIHEKYGKNILFRASALTDYSTSISRHEMIGGHKK